MHTILTAIEQLLDRKMNSGNDDFFDVQQACFFLGISKSTLYKMNFEKKLPYYKGNGSKKIYYKKSELIAYITQNRLKSKAEIEEEARQFLKERKGNLHV